MDKRISPPLKKQIRCANCHIIKSIFQLLHILLKTLNTLLHPHGPGTIYNIVMQTKGGPQHIHNAYTPLGFLHPRSKMVGGGGESLQPILFVNNPIFTKSKRLPVK